MLIGSFFYGSEELLLSLQVYSRGTLSLLRLSLYKYMVPASVKTYYLHYEDQLLLLKEIIVVYFDSKTNPEIYLEKNRDLHVKSSGVYICYHRALTKGRIIYIRT
jgi:hypothetical protein